MPTDAAHLQRLHATAQLERSDEPAQRAIERRIRCAAVACRRSAHRLGQSTGAIAMALGLQERTLRQWIAHHGATGHRGRPTHPVTGPEARLMRLALLVHGPHVGTATLQAWCPTLSRRTISAWQRRDRQQRRQRLAVVRWTRPGRVWAMDFSDPPQPIDGYGALLHVRDLASQQQLAVRPVPRATAVAACDLLRALCATHDAPVVLKVDNGSAFVSHDLRAWAAAAGTQLLYSPPACPRYNGGIEASIGAITAHAHQAAAAAGHPEVWTCADVEAARLQANAVAPVPAITRIASTERRRFAQHYHAALGSGDHHAPIALQRRTAIVHTLQVLGYVSITRRADIVHPLAAQKRKRFRT